MALIEIRDLRCLAAAASALNFARAAKSLKVETSTVSRRIARLEDELGLALFERGNTGVRLTSGGQSLMVHVHRALAEIDAVTHAASQKGIGQVGAIRLGVRLAPIGEPLRSLLGDWHQKHPDVMLTISEMSSGAAAIALAERRVDVALMTSFTKWPDSATAALYRERLVAALPHGHPLAERETIQWVDLCGDTILIQEWDDSHVARESYASYFGSSAQFHPHAAGKQSILALVAAQFGVTLATASQAEVRFPGVIFKPIAETNAWIEHALVWRPELEDPAVGRFIAFLRDETLSRRFV